MTPYREHAQILLERFVSLTGYTRRQLFPPARRLEEQPLPATMRQRIIRFLLHSPVLQYETGPEWIVFSLMFWGQMVILWVTGAQRILGLTPWVSTQPAATPPLAASSPWLALPVLLFLLMFLLVALAAIVASYAGWVDFWRDRRHSAAFRIRYTLIFLIIVAGVTWWGFPRVAPASIRWALWQDPLVTAEALGVYLALLVPAATITYRMIPAFVDWLFTDVMTRPLVYVVKSYRPLAATILQRLSQESIPLLDIASTVPSGQTWKLADLSPEDLSFLREWAQANREATEKRLLPTTVLFGAVGLFADTDAFNGAVQGVLRLLEQLLTLNVWWLNFPAMFIFLWVAVFAIAIFRLIENLIVQSLIIEACMIAENAQRAAASPAPPVKKCWFRWW